MKNYEIGGVTLLSNQEQSTQTTEVHVEFKGWEQFGKSFEYMGTGMLGIFIVTAIIIASITLLNKIKTKK